MTSRLSHSAVSVLAIAGWLLFAWISWAAIAWGWRETTGGVRQVDWHVYLAGARDLAVQQLYRHPLELQGAVLSSPVFNLPPLAAGWALPLVGVPVVVGGEIWQAAAALCVAATAVIALHLGGLRRPLLRAGLLLGPLSLSLLYLEGLHLGTNNYLVLALVAGFAWAHLAGRQRAAGLLLALAVGTKLWPIVLAVPAIRERRWRTLRWLAAGLGLQAVLSFAWLGQGFVSDLMVSLQARIPPTGLLIGPSADPMLRGAWNAGLGVAIAVLLLALPLRGRAGLGVAMLAGLAAIPNLWLTYGLTALLAVDLVIADLLPGWDRARRPSAQAHAHPDQQGQQDGQQKQVAGREQRRGPRSEVNEGLVTEGK